jgi:toxin secretion/phage lysis holin
MNFRVYTWLVSSISITPLISYLETYIFCDWEFLQFLVILIAIDTILGISRSFRYREIHSGGFARIFLKMAAYMTILILSHVLTNYTVGGTPNIMFLWFDDMAYAAIIIREAISILENVAAIYPQGVPEWLLKRLKEFDFKGKIKHPQS